MKPSALLALAVCLFAAAVAAWTKEDHEIFRLRDEVAANNGANVTFYDLFGVKPSASQDELSRAYRRKSRDLHPDKARSKFVNSYALKTPARKPSKKEVDQHVKQVTVAYQRLTVIANILKGPARERYDHFLRHGFPKWRGSGYYYARFRPGLGAVLAGLLVVVGGGVHYFALVVGWNRRREFVERYIRHARKTAWGDSAGIPGVPQPMPESDPAPEPSSNDDDQRDDMAPMNRRQKRIMDKENKKDKKSTHARAARRTAAVRTSSPDQDAPSGPQGQKRRIVAQNGKVLVVDSVGNVFLEEESDEGVKQEFLLDVDEEPKPTVYDTLLFKLPVFVYNQSVGRVLGNQRAVEEPLLRTEDQPEDEAALQSATASNANGEARKRKAKARATR